MLKRIHERLGLSGPPPKVLKGFAIIAPLIGMFALIGLTQLRLPEHVGYIEATLVSIPTSGIIPGDVIVIKLPDGDERTIRSSLRMNSAQSGDQVCIQHLTDKIRGGAKYRTVMARRCSGNVVPTRFRLL